MESQWVLEKVVIGGLTRLHQGVTTIGRSPTCTITIASDFVSRTHAEFEVLANMEDIQIRDLGSTNGIFVNDLLYNRVACRLHPGDRIGIGVSVEDNQVTPDGKYPMFVLRRIPLVEGNFAVERPNEENDVDQQIVIPQEAPKVEAEIIPLSPETSTAIHDDCEEQIISDKEYDSDDNEDDFVHPSAVLAMESCTTTHQAASISIIDIQKRNTVTENIQSIFGNFNPDVLSTLSKDTRAIAEASTSKTISTATIEEDVICISSDDECENSRPKSTKSPDVFGDSFNTDEDVSNDLKIKEVAIVELPTNEPEQSSKVDDVDENEEEELYFTQRLYDELREELPDPYTEITTDYKVDEKGTLIITPIKQEKLSQSVDGIINLDDDDEYDEALESKVNDWSFKLFSQSFSNSFNSSQIYEDDLDNAPATTTEGIFINIDDDDSDGNSPGGFRIKREKDADIPLRGASVSSLITPSPSEKEDEEQMSAKVTTIPEDITESPLIRQRKRSSVTKIHISSSSSEEDDHEKVTEKQDKERSLPSTAQDNEKIAYVRKLSTTDEIPQKKPRLTSKAEENKKGDKQSNRRSSSSVKTYSRQSSERSEVTKSRHSSEDPFDKLKKLPNQTRRSSSESKNITESKKSKDNSGSSTVFRRSSSAAEETSGKSYMSATIARRKSLGNQTYAEENEEDDFEEVKKSGPSHTTPTKMIRGPPAIINPPQMPVNRGKLRGVSAAQKRSVEIIKAIQGQKDLKRKWIEKPSITKRKEKEMCKAIKEDRKQKLKELADKKNSDVINTKDKVSSKENDPEKISSKKPKVKVTSVNRGAFLAEKTPVSSKNFFKIPKKHNKSNKTESTSYESLKPSNSKTKKLRTTPTKASEDRKISAAVPTTFSMELLKADAILQNDHKQSASTANHNRQKSTDVPNEQKERAPPRRNNKKLTFDAMEQHFEETNRLQEMKNPLAKASSIKSPIAKPKKKKYVRFNDVPEIFYIEPVPSATRKVDKKETSTFNDRRTIIRRRFPIVDHTDELLNDVLSWSQLLLENKQFDMNEYNMVYPMTNQFTSIKNYNSTIFPLLKIEFLSHLERHMQRYASKPGYKIRVDYLTQYKGRELMFAKCSTPIKQSELGATDLALLDIVVGSTTNQVFGYIGNIRKAESLSCITIEINKNAIDKDVLKNSTQITVRRIMESIRVCFGSFNAVYQLEQTPLFQKILNPLEILNVKTHRRRPIQYKGCDPLNPEQKEILLKTYAKAIDEYNPNISLIEGPPGTGKSRLITNLALQLLYGDEVRMLDKKILICAQSNMAVDVIAQKLLTIQRKLSPRAPKYQVIRFGKEEKIHKNVKEITVSKLIQRDQKARLQETSGSHDYSGFGDNLNNEILRLEARVAELQKENLKDVRQDELIEMRKNLALKKSIQNQSLRPEDERRLFVSYLENANIICTTLSSCVKLSSYVNFFDVCIIDEATQCIEPWTIMPLKFGATSLILVGDTQQLPATVISQKAKDYGLGTSLFTRIQNCLENNSCGEPCPILSLHTQYRMHPEICKWPNMYFYKNQLLNAPNTAEFKSQIKPFSILNLEYTQNAHCGNGQITNSLEAEFVAKLVKTLNLYIPNKFFSYGVITPYAQHREQLEVLVKASGLKDIMVNTIDSYQGIEKDVIIISNARTQGIGFLANYQRLNVALTRPKKCLILCGNFKNLETVPSWASLLANARKRGLFHDISIADASDIDKNVIEKIKIKRQ